MILHTSYHPDFLQNAMFRELMLCSLLKDYKKVQGNIEIVRSEIMDMLEMDIPYFYMNSSELSLCRKENQKIITKGYDYAKHLPSDCIDQTK